MRRTLLLAGLLGAGCVQETTAAPPPQSTTSVIARADSVILVTIDTLRADIVGAYGGRAHTPVLDALAARGWLFERCISSSMLTNPSHASILTSLYPRDHGVYTNESGITDGVQTLATAADRNGLRTAAVINFPHLNPGVANLGAGFQRLVPATRKERRAAEISAEALSILDSYGPRERFFFWLHYTDPHAPYDPPAEHPPREPPAAVRTPMAKAQQAAPGFQRNNPWFSQAFKSARSVEHMMERYVAEVETADAGLGVLLDGLAARGRRETTAIVVISDHGESFGEHQLYFNHGGLYLTSVHVPLLIAVPGVPPARVSGLVESIDVAPTVLALLGVPRWEPMRGQSLVEVAFGQAQAREFAYSEHMQAQLVAVRSSAGTLILHRKSSRQFPSYPFVAGRRELYVTSQDPGEEHPLGADNALAGDLGRALDRYLETGLQLAARPAVDQDRDSLRSLGYVE